MNRRKNKGNLFHFEKVPQTNCFKLIIWNKDKKEDIIDTIIKNHKQNVTNFNKGFKQEIITATLKTDNNIMQSQGQEMH